MFRKLAHALSIVVVAMATACGGSSGGTDLQFPAADLADTGTSQVSAQVLRLGEGLPEGRRITFVGDEIIVRGKNFLPGLNVFFGVNTPLTELLDSIFKTPRHRLPNAPFVWTDPDPTLPEGDPRKDVTLEVGVPVEFFSAEDVKVRIPSEVACTTALTNPTVRFYGKDGSSFPQRDIFHVVGPMAIALTPNKIPDVGGESVIVHGDFFSTYTQIAFRYTDPKNPEKEIIIGHTAETDIQEIFIDRHTLVIPAFPGVVPNSNLGLAEELVVDILVYENIEEITSNEELEPQLQGRGACSGLRQPSSRVQIEENGVRNSERIDSFTFLPTGVTDYPSVAGIVPEFGSEMGGNTVIIHGDQFDGFSVDLSDSDKPGIAIECPPGSDTYVAPMSATLVDRQTIVVKMPKCEVEIPQMVNICITNKFSIDNPVEAGIPLGVGTESNGVGAHEGDCVIFPDIYEYRPIPPITEPFVHAIHAVSGDDLEVNTGNGYGLQKFLVVGDWFDSHTELNGGFEFVFATGEVVQSLRTIVRSRNLLEIYTSRLPDSLLPLAGPVPATVRARNVIGHRDQATPFTFVPLADADATPSLTEICATGGSSDGDNQILVYGANFDSTTDVLFDGLSATRVQYINPGLLIATVPSADDVAGFKGTDQIGFSIVTVMDDGEAGTGSADYEFGIDSDNRALLGSLDPDTGSSTGGYSILAYGVNFSPLVEIEFGEGDGNFSHNITYLGSNLLLVEVPEAFDAQIGATVDVALTDPRNGLDESVKLVDFTYTAAQQAAPEILFVATTVVDVGNPISAPDQLPALNIAGGDKMLIIGRNFDQRTSFDITKPQGTNTKGECTSVEVLTPNIAVCTSPASPDGLPGIADLQGHNDFGDSNLFPVEYVEPGPPNIIDVRNLDTGNQNAPIDAQDRLVIFGDNFFDPVTVTLIGCDIDDQTETVEVILTGVAVTVLNDHMLGIDVPADTFCEGDLRIKVTTDFGDTWFETLAEGQSTGEGTAIFQLVGPQPPIVTGVFPSKFNTGGGEEVIFYGKYFTSSTDFDIRTSGDWEDVLNMSLRIVSNEVAIARMPILPGGPFPTGLSGDVRATETNATLANKIAGDAFTISEDMFTVCNDAEGVLLALVPDHGFIGGGEQVLVLGANFLKDTGESNVDSITMENSDLGVLLSYTEYTGMVPISSADKGEFMILNDHEILLITAEHPIIADPDTMSIMDVSMTSQENVSTINGAFTYSNTPAVIKPFLLGITPNETRLNGDTSHLLSGGFLTSATKIAFIRESDNVTLELDVTSDDFKQVNDNFLVFVMPDLTPKFNSGDKLSVQAIKEFKDGDGIDVVLKSNILHMALKVTFAGPPIINAPTITPDNGTAFGGTQVTIEGSLFTTNTQVLFGTMPARHVVYVNPGKIIVIAPTLAVSLPAPGVALDNVDTADGTVDLAVFTQGGWAVAQEAYEFKTDAPTVTSCSPDNFNEGETVMVTVKGTNFVPGTTSMTFDSGLVVAPGAVDVIDFETLQFEYTAPTEPAGTVGPSLDLMSLKTNHGTAPGCLLSINLTPFIDDCTTNFPANDLAAPSTGVAEIAGTFEFVKVTVDGGNFLKDGTLTLNRGAGTDPIVLTYDATLTGGGRWAVNLLGTEITFTVPNIFSSDTPTLLDGNRNIGPVTLIYESPDGAHTVVTPECFSYVPSVIGFRNVNFVSPPIDPTTSSLDKPTAGDINGDGVPDIVILVRQTADTHWNNKLEDSDAVVFIANTFGAADINGDGKTPDFNGTYTRTVIANDDFRTHLYQHGRGGRPLLLQLDGDKPLEIVLPGITGADDTTGTPQILIIDVNADGSLGTNYLIEPTLTDNYTAIAGIAAGSFDDTDTTTPDIACIIGSATKAHRKIVIFKSTATNLVFTDSSLVIESALNSISAGYLESGDFDGDTDDDLMWGASAFSSPPIVVGEINSATGTFVDQKKLTNITGGRISGIVTRDLDNDGKAEAYVLVENNANGSLVGNEKVESGIIVVLDPIPDAGDPEADAYVLTGMIDHARGLAIADLDGDGNMDLAVGSNEGELVVMTGNPDQSINPPARSWFLPTTDGSWPSRVHGIAVADLNRDGLAEIFAGDMGINPMSLEVFLNTSR